MQTTTAYRVKQPRPSVDQNFEKSPDQAYGLGRPVQRAYVADYTIHEVPNNPAEARQDIPGPNACDMNYLSLRDITSSNASFILAFRFFFTVEE